MNRFLLKLVLYGLPFIVVVGGFAGALVYSGEAMPLSMVVALQSGDEPVLYRPQYGNRDLDFKLLSTETRKPEILAIGSSRVLQFRSMFFNRNTRAFYNAGAPAWSLDTVDDFLRQLDDSAWPGILIIGLDHPWFNDAFVPDEFPESINDLENIVRVTASVLQEKITGQSDLDFDMLMARREPMYGGLALGIKAIRDGHGFRNDGSEQYGDFLVAHFLSQPIERDRHLYFLQNGEQMYVRGDHVSEAKLSQLENILQRCQEHGTYVIGFSPPFMPTLYEQMMADGQHGYVPEMIDRLRPLLESYGFAYFDFSNGAWLNANDEDFFDGWHASEMIHIVLYIRMLEALPGVLGPYSDGNFLYSAVANATDTFNVFGNQF
jgi:hypothetical protein